MRGLCWGWALGIVACAGSASAANEDGVPLSADALMTGATIASHDGSTGAWYNPAALGGLSRSSVQLTASIYTLGVRGWDGLVETRLPWETHRENVRSTDFTTIPSCLSFVLRLGDRVGLSLGIFSPVREYMTVESTWTSTSPVLASGNHVTYDQSIAYSSRIDSTQVGLGLGVKVTDTLRLGAGVFVSQDTAEQIFDVSYTATVDETGEKAFTGFVTRRLGSRFGFRGTAGVQWDVAKWLTLALAVRSPTVGFASSGKATATVYTGSPSGSAFTRLTEPEAHPTLGRPLRVHWASEARFGIARIALEGDVRHPLSDPYLGADKWVANGRVGATFQIHRDVWLGGGAFTDMGGATVARSGVEIDYFGGTLGVQFRSPDVVRVRAGSDGWDLRTSIAMRYAAGVGQLGGLLIAPLGGAQQTSQPSAALYHEISLNVATALEL